MYFPPRVFGFLSLAVMIAGLVAWTVTRPGGHDELPSRSCASLLSLTDFQFSVVEAHMEPASEDAPGHCRVYGRILPDIRFAVFLPIEWNGRLSMAGNGGWAGSIPEGRMGFALREGSVSIGTDTGHDGRREPGGKLVFRRKSLIRDTQTETELSHLSITFIPTQDRMRYEHLRTSGP